MAGTTIEISDVVGLEDRLTELDEVNTIFDNSNLNFYAITTDTITIYKNAIVGYDNEDNLPTISADTTLDVSGKLIVTNIEVSNDAIIRGSTVFERLDISDTLTVYGDVTFKAGFSITDLDISNTLIVNGDVTNKSKLDVLGDVSMQSHVDISDSLNVGGNVVHNSDFQVLGDVSMQSHVDISDTLTVDGDVTHKSNLEVIGDVSMASSVFIKVATSSEPTLQVVGDVSMGSHVDISDTLIVGGNVTHKSDFLVLGDVSMQSHVDISNLQVLGDVSMQSHVDISDTLIVAGNVTHKSDFLVLGDVSMQSQVDIHNLQVFGDVSMQSKLDVSETVTVHGNVLHNSNLDVVGDVSINNNINVHNHSTLKNVQIDGTSFFNDNITFGNNTEDVSFVMYGDVVIKKGGNLIIEDDDFTITQLQTEVKITDILDISNNGTGTALKVTQNDTFGNDIVSFYDMDLNVFKISDGGKTFIHGDVSMASSLDISNSLNVDHDLVVSGLSTLYDANVTGNLQVASVTDVENSVVTLDNSMGRMELITTGMDYNGTNTIFAKDISANSNVDISENLHVDKDAFVSGNLSVGSSSFLKILGTPQTPQVNNLLTETYSLYDDFSKNISLCNSNSIKKYSIGLLKHASTNEHVFSITGDVSNSDSVPNNVVFAIDQSGNAELASRLDLPKLKVSDNVFVDGTVGIGIETPQYELDISGDIHNTGTLFSDSDLNIKKNLVKLDNSLEKISNLNGYYYHKTTEDDDALKHIGVIAQEVEEEFPELVSNSTKTKSVNYDGINAVLIECVKQLYDENKMLKKEIEQVKKIINSHLLK